jgi:hypothetical protein
MFEVLKIKSNIRSFGLNFYINNNNKYIEIKFNFKGWVIAL